MTSYTLKRALSPILAIVMIAIVVASGGIGGPVRGAATTLPVTPTMPVIDFLLWLVAPTGLLGIALAWFFVRFGWPDPWPELVSTFLLTGFGAVMQIIVTRFLDPSIANLTLWEGVLLLFQVLIGWVGLHWGAFKLASLVSETNGDATGYLKRMGLAPPATD